MAGRDRRELRSRLATLLEHILKRCIERTRFEIVGILRQSPSLKKYLRQDALFQEAFAFALRTVKKNLGYNSSDFPEAWQFGHDMDAILTVNFWELDD